MDTVANRTKLTDEKKEKFLSALRKGHSVARAAKAISVSRTTVYEHRNAEDEEEFRAEWDAAIEEGTDALEDEARRRAVEGTLKPVYYKGDKVGHIREYSDTLLIVLLKARRPDKYRERHEVVGANGGPVNVRVIRDGDAED